MLQALKGRMAWLQARQAVLAGNVAHSDTPGFRPRDLAPPTDRAPGLALAASDGGASLAGHTGAGGSRSIAASAFETRPSGNAVSLEEEMLKIAETQMEHQMIAGLYQRSLATLKTAIGRRG